MIPNMNKLVLSAFLILAGFSFSNCGVDPEHGARVQATTNLTTKATNAYSQISLQEALHKAEFYIKTNNISLSGLTLVGSYHSEFTDANNNRWTFIWVPLTNTPMMDAELRVYVDDNGKISLGGE
jgi:hypothetical protein